MADPIGEIHVQRFFIVLATVAGVFLALPTAILHAEDETSYGMKYSPAGEAGVSAFRR